MNIWPLFKILPCCRIPVDGHKNLLKKKKKRKENHGNENIPSLKYVFKYNMKNCRNIC